MHTIKMQPDLVTWLGHQGENGVREAVFSIGTLIERFGAGSVTLLVLRNGDTAAYPVTPIVTGTSARWILSNADTANAGFGRVELQYHVGQTLAKSSVFAFSISQNIGDTTETPPSPYATWLQQVIEAKQSALNAAVHPPIIDENENWKFWSEQQQDYVSSELPAVAHTPVRGTDYWTEADKQTILSEVLTALPTWTGGEY